MDAFKLTMIQKLSTNRDFWLKKIRAYTIQNNHDGKKKISVKFTIKQSNEGGEKLWKITDK